jgi:hypothetical protein
VNDPVAARLIRITEEMHWGNMTRAEATALVDAQIAEEEAWAKAYLGLMTAARQLRESAA